MWLVMRVFFTLLVAIQSLAFHCKIVKPATSKLDLIYRCYDIFSTCFINNRYRYSVQYY